ncbi:MAG: phosphoribosylanthranilate isomerase [Armatimonadetes bacterium]|nr:phosphoribosylanthranilate isomerase [Armatimonadota bacterium]MDW8028791.1 phosphoribosylanthranilate isomerase [Armatimonadota bacterium]
MSVKVKICGLTRIKDVQIACSAGSDFCGVVVEIRDSPRSQTKKKAKELFAASNSATVAVTRAKVLVELVELFNFLSPFAIQLHGDETPELIAALKLKISCQIWKAIPLPTMEEEPKEFLRLLTLAQDFVKSGCDALVLDAASKSGFGGKGVAASWELATKLVEQLDVPCFLAGGLTPENVGEAIRVVKPFGVDVSSGVEISPGVKDAEKIRLFCLRAKVGYKSVRAQVDET